MAKELAPQVGLLGSTITKDWLFNVHFPLTFLYPLAHPPTQLVADPSQALQEASHLAQDPILYGLFAASKYPSMHK
jgi:hypothetical protein